VRRPLAPAVVAAVALTLGACGDDPSAADDSTPASGGTTVDDVDLVPGDSTTTIPRTPEPAVSVPAAIPTALVVTDLRQGTGYAAAVGDTLLVDYVGVRTADGTKFDSSYERGIPYGFPLGQGRVIEGWEQGLVGIQVGTQRQLDVPTDLAYADSPPGGSVIQPGDALSFVIEARAVIPAPDRIAAPTDIAFEPSVGAEDLVVTDLVVGTGPPIEAGQTAVVHMLFVRGDDNAILFDTWANADPLQFQLVDGGTAPGLVTGLVGMRVGGRRMITMPPDQAFGPGGDPQLGLPANTDLIVVAEMFGLF
jgi:FKBP-type peptidyl-prolyl cis-trans isomerase